MHLPFAVGLLPLAFGCDATALLAGDPARRALVPRDHRSGVEVRQVALLVAAASSTTVTALATDRRGTGVRGARFFLTFLVFAVGKTERSEFF